MSDSNNLLAVDLVIVLVGLLSLAIHRISESSVRSYEYLMAIISIIRRFSLVILSLIMHS